MAIASIMRQVQIEMPWKEKDKYVQCHDGEKQFKVKFVMYADFESILEPMEKSSKGRVNKHVSSGFCVYSKFAYGMYHRLRRRLIVGNYYRK